MRIFCASSAVTVPTARMSPQDNSVCLASSSDVASAKS
jgi:hypothetical protein